MPEEVCRHRAPAARAALGLALSVALGALVPRSAPAFPGIHIPGSAAPVLLHVEGELSPEPPERGRFLSVGINGVTRYLTIDTLRSVNTWHTELALYDRLKPRSPNLELKPLEGAKTEQWSDRQLLGKRVVLEGYVRFEDRSPMLVTKLEAVSP